MKHATERRPPPLTPEQERQRDLLYGLVQTKLPGRHAFFFTSVEGLFMPDGTEEVSGYVIDEQGCVFSFWMDWDARRGAPALGTWKKVEPQPHWVRSREYRQAREAVGLAPA